MKNARQSRPHLSRSGHHVHGIAPGAVLLLYSGRFGVIPGQSLHKEFDMDNESSLDLPERTADTEQPTCTPEENDEVVEIITVVKSCAYDPLTRL
jgi:hypothetical protein